jgi:serine phosphatase RsbU (regulator of sigma subunit)
MERQPGERLQELEFELESSRARLRLALTAGRMGSWTWDRINDAIEWDELTRQLFGRDTAPATFADWLATMPEDDRARTQKIVDDAVANKSGYWVLRPVATPGQPMRWVESRADVVVVDGEVVGLQGLTVDVTDREEVRARAERLATSAELLARSGRELAETLDPELVLRRATQLAVPEIADACEIATLEPKGLIRRRLHALLDGVVDERLARRVRAPLAAADPVHPVAEVVRTGVTRHLRFSEPADRAGFGSPDIDTTAASFDLRHVVIVPMTVRGEIIGALSVGRGPSGRAFDDEDVRVVTELASRTALAFDNARLYSNQARIARTLQRSLVPAALEAPAWIELDAQSWVPEFDTDVGGDFYDAVIVGDSLIAFIGDVCGKGADAASLTALARHTLRTGLAHLDDLGAAVAWLHQAAVATVDDSFITLVVVRFWREDGVVRGQVVNAGHPRPVIVRANGDAEVVDGAGTPVGFSAWTAAPVVECELRRGDVFVAYTDGITDVPGDGQLSQDDVLRLFASLGAAGGASMVAGLGAWVEANRSGAERTDDIAVLSARVIDPEG